MLDRIQKLMALALHNPSEEEARSAALKAVQLIAAHKLTLTAPAADRPAAPSPLSYEDLATTLRANMRRQREAWEQQRQQAVDDILNGRYR